MEDGLWQFNVAKVTWTLEVIQLTCRAAGKNEKSGAGKPHVSIRLFNIEIVTGSAHSHIRLLHGTKARVIQSTSIRCLRVIQQDRICDLLNRHRLDLLRREKREGSALNGRGNGLCDVHRGHEEGVGSG